MIMAIAMKLNDSANVFVIISVQLASLARKFHTIRPPYPHIQRRYISIALVTAADATLGSSLSTTEHR